MTEPSQGKVPAGASARDRAVLEFRAERARNPGLEAREYLRRKGWDEAWLPYLEQPPEAPDATLETDGEAATSEAEAPPPTGAAETIGVDPAPTPDFDRRYRIVRELGAGGYGKVYLVQDALNANEEVALKLIRSDRLDTPQVTKRFRNEIRTMRALSHPGIPQIYNDGLTEAGEFYYTMAYVRGRSLSDVIRGDAPLAPERVVRLVRQMIDVLDYAHKRGVVHRDLKPGNVILVDPGGEKEQVKVLDFGIAKLLAREGELENALTMNTEAAIGTPHYMAPEQVRGKEVDGRTDLYALGIIIYQMCTGKMPFTGTTVMEILSARLEQQPTPLVKGQVPEWLETLVMSLLEREREKRPTADAVLAQLQTMTSGQRSLGRQLRWIAAGLLVLSVSVAWLILSQGSTEPGPKQTTGVAQGGGPVSRPAETIPTESRGDPTEAEQAELPERVADKGAKPVSPPKASGEDAPGTNSGVDSAARNPGAVEPSVEPPKPPLAALEWISLEPQDGTLFEPSTRTIEVLGSASLELSAALVNGEPAQLDGSKRTFRRTLQLPEAKLASERIDLVIAATDTAGRALEAKRSLWRAAARAPEGHAPLPGTSVDASGWAHEVRAERTGLELVLVPAAEGFAAFYIGKTEVSWSAFERVLGNQPSDRHDFDKPGFDRKSLEDHPVVQVDPEEAQRFCAGAGYELPTRAQWVRAAGGTGRAYPWGDGPAQGTCNLEGTNGDDTFELTAPCGAMRNDVSPLGVLDLAGNVREWCRDDGGFTLCGGSWNSDEAACRIDFVPRRVPAGGDDKTGFRVVLQP